MSVAGRTLALQRMTRLCVNLLFAFLLLASLHLLVYVVLRFAGIYEIYYNMGYGDVRGGVGLFVIDITVLPWTLLEGEIHVQLDQQGWMPHPAGG